MQIGTENQNNRNELSLTAGIREIFKKASLQHAMAKGLNGNDWAVYRQIEEAHDERVRQAQRDHMELYETRVELAKKQLIDKAASKTQGFAPPWLGQDRFDKSAIDRQAHRMVADGHARHLTRLEDQKDQQIAELLKTANRRLTLSTEIKEQFAEAARQQPDQDPRQGPTRSS
jgi:hypothetical protein